MFDHVIKTIPPYRSEPSIISPWGVKFVLPAMVAFTHQFILKCLGVIYACYTSIFQKL